MPRDDAAQFHELVSFEERGLVNDGYGNTVAGDWVEQFQAHANITFLRGGETVMASRLESRMPAVVRVRWSQSSGQVTNDWRIRDTRKGTIFNIRTVTRDPSRSFVDCLAETGVAV